MPSVKLVLFDIDQTLVDVLPSHERAYEKVFREVYGIEARLREIDFAGKTVEGIIRELALKKGVRTEEMEAKLGKAATALDEAFVEEVGEGEVRPLRGVRDLLSGLEGRGSLLGVITGNSERIGKTILRRSSLLPFFRVSAFGSEGRDKGDLVTLAAERGSRILGETVLGGTVAVVGDSVRDIAGGRAFGALTIAVATGPHTREELLSYRPDHLLDDLGGVEEVLEILFPKSPRRAPP